jgi:hypothetical protein
MHTDLKFLMFNSISFVFYVVITKK